MDGTPKLVHITSRWKRVFHSLKMCAKRFSPKNGVNHMIWLVLSWYCIFCTEIFCARCYDNVKVSLQIWLGMVQHIFQKQSDPKWSTAFFTWKHDFCWENARKSSNCLLSKRVSLISIPNKFIQMNTFNCSNQKVNPIFYIDILLDDTSVHQLEINKRLNNIWMWFLIFIYLRAVDSVYVVWKST